MHNQIRLFCTLTACLLTCLPADARKSHDFPQAYAGLNPGAYVPVLPRAGKNGGLSFQWRDLIIDVPVNTLNKTSSGQNVSFVQSIPGGVINATAGNNSLFGHMHIGGKQHILTTNQAGIWAVELPAGLSHNDCGVDHTEHASAAFTPPPPAVSQKAAGTIIDVLMLYDQAIADRYPGALLQTRVDQYFSVSNQAYANSGLDLAIRQVGLEQIGYDFDDANINARNLLQSALSVGTGSQGMESVPQLYADSGADLVIFLRTHNIETRGNCGIAFFPVSQNQSGFDPSYGVNIMADGMSSWSVCTDQLMVHEIGHNLGAGHHNVDQQFRFIPDAAGFAKLGQFGTVMGSFGTGRIDRFLELNYFSNPAVQCGGGPCGVAGQFNNANVISQLMGPVASYQAATSQAPLPPDFNVALIDQDGDGVPDQDDEFPFDAEETVDSDGDGVGDVKDRFPAQASEQFDFDGDGIGDNSDFDDDGDGILDQDDAFPFDPSEVGDSDRDGYGDIADAFVFEASEHLDSDNDNIGNNDDIDDDNDGFTDVSLTDEDVLVISVGNNRILRYDAQTGLSKGIEVLPDDGLLTFQSDLTFDAFTDQLFFTSSSSVRLLDLQDPYARPETLIPPYDDLGGVQLGTGFPTALEVNQNRGLLTAKLRATSLDFYDYSNITFPAQAGFGDFGVDQENIIAIERSGDAVYLLGQETEIYQGSVNGGSFSPLGTSNKGWLVDPYDFVVVDDVLLHTDQSRNKVLITRTADGSYGGEFADLAALGYGNPTGIDATNDGRVLVAVAEQNAILAFNAEDGEFLGELVSGFGLDQPHRILIVPQLNDRFHKDPDKVLRPNAGNWYNPQTSGRGFNVGIFNNLLQILWFTYDEDENPIWYNSSGPLVGHNYSAQLLKYQLNPDDSLTIDIVGQLDIDFANERQATVDWTIGAFSQTEEIEWFQFSLEPESAYLSGMWTRPDAPGWGLAVTTIGEQTVTIPFIYDGDGQPRWAISDVASGEQPFAFNMGTLFSDSLCPSCTGSNAPDVLLSGTLTLDLSDQAYWDSDITWPAPLPGDWVLDQSELVRISSPATRPR